MKSRGAPGEAPAALPVAKGPLRAKGPLGAKGPSEGGDEIHIHLIRFTIQLIPGRVDPHPINTREGRR